MRTKNMGSALTDRLGLISRLRYDASLDTSGGVNGGGGEKVETESEGVEISSELVNGVDAATLLLPSPLPPSSLPRPPLLP